MRYTYVVTEDALTDLAKLDVVTKKRLSKKLQHFVVSGQPLTFAKQLVNVQPPMYRFRVGKYRVFFDKKGTTLRILAVEKRDQAYRNIHR